MAMTAVSAGALTDAWNTRRPEAVAALYAVLLDPGLAAVVPYDLPRDFADGFKPEFPIAAIQPRACYCPSLDSLIREAAPHLTFRAAP